MTISRLTNDDFELTDADVGHALTLGSAVGIPAIFAIVFVVGLVAGATWTESVVMATWPAVVGGPFFGALAALGGVVRTHEHRAVVVPIAADSRPTTVAPTRAA